jgi:hypothetical protein
VRPLAVTSRRGEKSGSGAPGPAIKFAGMKPDFLDT